MQPPHSITEVYENEYAQIWIENGILINAIKVAQPTLQQVEEHMKMLKEKFTDQFPLPVIAMSHQAQKTSKEVRDYISKEMNGIVKATAIVTGNNTFVKLAGNLFLKFLKTNTPIKLFSAKESAMDWLEQFK